MIYFDNLTFDTELKYEVYLLNKYLIKHYNSEISKKLLKANKHELDKLAKALGEQDIAFFCLYFMSDIFVVKDDNAARELSEGHYELWGLGNDAFIKDLYDKLNIIEPRGFAKTTIFDLAISVWLHCYKKSIFTLIGAKKDDDATQFVDSIKKVFLENKKIIKVFGNLIEAKKVKKSGERYTVNANEIEFTNETYIRAVGSASSVRGANWKGIRPTVVIADDYQDEKDILTEDAREKKYNRWTKEIEQVGDKAVYRNGVKIKSATKIISIGTVLHIDCLMSRLSRNNDYKTILRRAIILGPDEAVEDIFESSLWLKCKNIYFNDKLEDSKEAAREFYEEHKEEMKFKTLWEEKWDCFNDLAVAYWENRISFMSELMNDATSIGEKWFKSVATRPSAEIEEHSFIKTMLIVDPASTTTKKSDYTFIGVGSEATNGFTYVRDFIMKRLEFTEYCNKVIEILENHGDITHIQIEKNTYQGADVTKIKELIAKHPKLKFKRYEFINEMQRKNKDEKISTVIDPVNNGQIILNQDCEDCKEVVDQIKDFQGQQYTLHDDAIDGIAELQNALKEIKVITIAKILDRKKLGL